MRYLDRTLCRLVRFRVGWVGERPLPYGRGSIFLAALSFAGAVGLAGCEKEPAQKRFSNVPKSWHSVYQRTSTEFFQAVFFKPRGDATDGFEASLAPLIVQEVSAEYDAIPASDRFGAVRFDKQGQAVIDATLPTIYTASTETTVRDRTYRQLVYVWWYEPSIENKGDSLSPPMQGIRLTLGDDGFPIVVEAWASQGVVGGENIPHVLFVSRSFEALASEQFGPPLSGRRYSVERGIDETPDIVAAGLIEDGPIPMGPYVYLDAKVKSVTTLLCRCSPSQVNRFVETDYYELQPLDRLDAWGFEVLSRRGWVNDRRREHEKPDTAPPTRLHLERILHWPSNH